MQKPNEVSDAKNQGQKDQAALDGAAQPAERKPRKLRPERVKPVTVVFEAAPISEAEDTRRLAALLTILTNIRRRCEAEGQRFTDENGNPVPPLEPSPAGKEKKR